MPRKKPSAKLMKLYGDLLTVEVEMAKLKAQAEELRSRIRFEKARDPDTLDLFERN